MEDDEKCAKCGKTLKAHKFGDSPCDSYKERDDGPLAFGHWRDERTEEEIEASHWGLGGIRFGDN